MNLAAKIRSIPDFPKKGIVFKDITTVLGDAEALHEAVRQLKERFKNDEFDMVVGIESRGFIFAGILAHEWGIGMALVRKPGKLPYKTICETYSLEYGQDSLHMHMDALQKGQRVLVIDDLLATGGTLEATIRLVERLGAVVVACGFLIELDFLKGRTRLKNYRIESLVHVETEA